MSSLHRKHLVGPGQTMDAADNAWGKASGSNRLVSSRLAGRLNLLRIVPEQAQVFSNPYKRRSNPRADRAGLRRQFDGGRGTFERFPVDGGPAGHTVQAHDRRSGELSARQFGLNSGQLPAGPSGFGRRSLRCHAHSTLSRALPSPGHGRLASARWCRARGHPNPTCRGPVLALPEHCLLPRCGSRTQNFNWSDK